MATFSDAAKETMLDQLVTTSGPFYVALFVGDPEVAGVEENGAAYARQPITFGPAVAGNKANSVAVVFDNGGATDWDAGVSHWALYDSPTIGAGNRISSANLGAIRDMSIANATLTFGIGDIDLNLNN